jgi:hypothetical protein
MHTYIHTYVHTVSATEKLDVIFKCHSPLYFMLMYFFLLLLLLLYVHIFVQYVWMDILHKLFVYPVCIICMYVCMDESFTLMLYVWIRSTVRHRWPRL